MTRPVSVNGSITMGGSYKHLDGMADIGVHVDACKQIDFLIATMWRSAINDAGTDYVQAVAPVTQASVTGEWDCPKQSHTTSHCH